MLSLTSEDTADSYNEKVRTYNCKLERKLAGFMLVAGSLICAGAFYTLKKEAKDKSDYFSQHKNYPVMVTGKNNAYSLWDTRLLNPVKYDFEFAKTKSDTSRMISENIMFGKVNDKGLILSKFKDDNFQEVLVAKNYRLENLDNNK